MKKVLFILVVFVFSLSSSFAQKKRGVSSEEMAKKQTTQMVEKLDLKGDQEKKVYTINKDYYEKLTKLRQENSGDREAMRGKMKRVREDYKKELKSVLTEEQYTTYQKMMEKRRQQMKKRGRS